MSKKSVLLGDIAIFKEIYLHELRAGDLLVTPAFWSKCFSISEDSLAVRESPYFATIFEPLFHPTYDGIERPEPNVEGVPIERGFIVA